MEKDMWWSFMGVLRLLTVIFTSGYFLFHFVQVRRMPPERAAYYTGSLVIWLGFTLLAMSAILPGLKAGFDALVGMVGFGLVVYGFYLNQQRDKRLNSPGATGPEPPSRSNSE